VPVPGGDNETVHTGRGPDHAVLDELIRGSVHEPTPFSKAARVHWKDLIGVRELIHPELNLRSSVGILLSGQLDAALQLAHCDGREEQLIVPHASNPGDNSAVGFPLPQFGNDIRVEQVLVHFSRTAPVDEGCAWKE
jgi:hypothetical protein